MTDEERKALNLALISILSSVRRIEIKTDAAEKVLEAFPALQSQYRKALAVENDKRLDDLNTTLEYLRKTLLANRE
jgi:hypothetical protein